MGACQVDDCTTAAKAKGLCPRHYMRAKRTGDPTTAPVVKTADPERAVMRLLFADWSDRTFARWWSAMRSVQGIGVEGEPAAEYATRAATRPNGSMNITEYERTCRAIRMLAGQPEHV